MCFVAKGGAVVPLRSVSVEPLWGYGALRALSAIACHFQRVLRPVVTLKRGINSLLFAGPVSIKLGQAIKSGLFRGTVMMDTGTFLGLVRHFKGGIFEFAKEYDPELFNHNVAEAGKVLKMVSPKSPVPKQVKEELINAYAILFRDKDDITPVDMFFMQFHEKMDENEVVAVNALRRAFWSLFYIEAKKDRHEYEIVDARTAARYSLKSIDELPLEEKTGWVGFIIPAPDSSCWYSIGGMMGLGRDRRFAEKIAIAKKKMDLQARMNAEFKEHFGSLIAEFSTRKKCEDGLTAFFEGQYEKRKLELLSEGKAKLLDGQRQPIRLALPAEMLEPIALFCTQEGIGLVEGYFEDYKKLVAGGFANGGRKKMIASIFWDKNLFADSMIGTLLSEREDELLALAKEAFPDVKDREGMLKKFLYFRPGLFDPKVPKLVLSGDLFGRAELEL